MTNVELMNLITGGSLTKDQLEQVFSAMVQNGDRDRAQVDTTKKTPKALQQGVLTNAQLGQFNAKIICIRSTQYFPIVELIHEYQNLMRLLGLLPVNYEIQGKSKTTRSSIFNELITVYPYDSSRVVNPKTTESYRFDIFESLVREEIQALRREFHNKHRLKAIVAELYPDVVLEPYLEATRDTWKARNLAVLEEKNYCIWKLTNAIETGTDK